MVAACPPRCVPRADWGRTQTGWSVVAAISDLRSRRTRGWLPRAARSHAAVRRRAGFQSSVRLRVARTTRAAPSAPTGLGHGGPPRPWHPRRCTPACAGTWRVCRRRRSLRRRPWDAIRHLIRYRGSGRPCRHRRPPSRWPTPPMCSRCRSTRYSPSWGYRSGSSSTSTRSPKTAQARGGLVLHAHDGADAAPERGRHPGNAVAIR